MLTKKGTHSCAQIQIQLCMQATVIPTADMSTGQLCYPLSCLSVAGVINLQCGQSAQSASAATGHIQQHCGCEFPWLLPL